MTSELPNMDIGRVLRQITVDTDGNQPPLLALTGTASRAPLKNMLIELSVDRTDPSRQAYRYLHQRRVVWRSGQ